MVGGVGVGAGPDEQPQLEFPQSGPTSPSQQYCELGLPLVLEAQSDEQFRQSSPGSHVPLLLQTAGGAGASVGAYEEIKLRMENGKYFSILGIQLKMKKCTAESVCSPLTEPRKATESDWLLAQWMEPVFGKRKQEKHSKYEKACTSYLSCPIEHIKRG